MTCPEARTDLALFAGGDLDDSARVRELRKHVAHCPECKSRYQSLKSSLKVLGAAGGVDVFASTTWESRHSLWPSIRREIARRPPGTSTADVLRQLRHWTPFAAMTAACVMALVALNQLGTSRDPQLVSPRGMTVHPPMALQTPEEEPKPASESESPSSSLSHPPQARPQF